MPKAKSRSRPKESKNKEPESLLTKTGSTQKTVCIAIEIPPLPPAINMHMEENTQALSRPLFTDGFNSFVHFTCGILAVVFRPLVPLFTLYQLLDPYDVNMYVDILEFIVGYTIAMVFL